MLGLGLCIKMRRQHITGQVLGLEKAARVDGEAFMFRKAVLLFQGRYGTTYTTIMLRSQGLVC